MTDMTDDPITPDDDMAATQPDAAVDAVVATLDSAEPMPAERIERIVNAIVRRLERSGETELSSELIGEQVMDALYTLDPVAYVRFASVYRNFREVKDFEEFVGKLHDDADDKD